MLEMTPSDAPRYSGLKVLGVWPGDPAFWDVQTTRRRHVARVVLDGVCVRVYQSDELWWPIRLHLLHHVSGFMLIRLTLRLADCPRTDLSDLFEWQRIGGILWSEEPLPWRLSMGNGIERPATVREVMDLVFFDIHERSYGRVPPSDRFLAPWSYEERYAWMDARVAAGEMRSAYPVSFGTYFETVWPGDAVPTTTIGNAAMLATPIRDDRPGGDVHADIQNRWWFFGENTSVLVLPESTIAADVGLELDVIDPIRAQIIEYLTLQRAAFRSVQRATQLAITEGQRVTRRQVATWNRLIAALSDDYVLHDQVAALLEPVRCHLHDNPALRDPAQLERQVRENLGSFDSLISSANTRAGVVLSALFGLVAATSLNPVVHELAYQISGESGGVDTFTSTHSTLITLLDIGTLIVLAVTAVIFFRVVTRVRTPPR